MTSSSPVQPRVALDTCIIRDFIRGDADVAALSRLNSRVRISVTGPALFEFAHALHEQRVPWSDWVSARASFHELLDPRMPVIDDGGALTPVRREARQRQRLARRSEPSWRARWEKLLQAVDLDELGSPSSTTGDRGEEAIVSMSADDVAAWLQERRDYWVEHITSLAKRLHFIGAVQKEAQRFKSGGNGLAPEQEALLKQISKDLATNGRIHLRGFEGKFLQSSEDTGGVDAYTRVQNLRANEHAWGSYDPRKHQNDGVDVMHLLVLGIPAILCTRDGPLKNLVNATKSVQADRVVTARDLVSLLRSKG